jgi:hypothetical protein
LIPEKGKSKRVFRFPHLGMNNACQSVIMKTNSITIH